MTAILGGGLSGLSAAFYLLKNKVHPVSVFESSKLVGGWIQSERQENGVIFELGPRTIRPHGIPGANTLTLIDELNLGTKIKAIPITHPAARNRLIYVNNELHKLPSGFLELLRKKPPFSKSIIRHVLHDLKASKVEKSDDSCYDFVSRRFGQEIAEYLISPLLCGICAGNSKEISVKFLMKKLFELEQTHGSVLRGVVKEGLKNRGKKKVAVVPVTNSLVQAKKEKWSVYSFDGGLSTLPKALYDTISKDANCEVQLGAPCSGIEFDGDSVKLAFEDKVQTFDHLISALNSHNLAPLLEKQHPVLAEELSKIPFVNVVVINLAYNKNLLKKQAFGFLVPPSQKLPILGVIFDSCCFDLKDQTVLTVMMGGHWFHQYFGQKPNEKELLDIALNQINRTLGIDEKPDIYRVSILNNCIAQYIVGHEARLDKINKYIEDNHLPMSLIGSSYQGVGINDVIMSAKSSVEKLQAKQKGSSHASFETSTP